MAQQDGRQHWQSGARCLSAQIGEQPVSVRALQRAALSGTILEGCEKPLRAAACAPALWNLRLSDIVSPAGSQRHPLFVYGVYRLVFALYQR